MNRSLSRISVVLVLAAVLASCLSIELGLLNDEELIAKGVSIFNEGKTSTARPYWAAIRDAEVKDKYVGYYDDYLDFEEAIEAAEALPLANNRDGTKLTQSYNALVKKAKALPAELKLPESAKKRMATLARNLIRNKIDSNQISSIPELTKTSSALLGESFVYADLQKEVDAINLMLSQERAVDAQMTRTRENEDFNAQIAGYEATTAAYRRFENTLIEQNKKEPYVATSPMTLAPARIRRKTQDSRLEMERMLRERTYSFKERIGEEFARVPEGSKLGNMSPAEILAFNETIRENINKANREMIEFGARYPGVIDKDMLKDVEAQRVALDARINQVAAEVRYAKDLASRGKPVAPLLIGLFNPLPGGKPGEQKSRPAAFRGNLSGNTEYWWGMSAIDRGTFNDMVITVRDGRAVRVYAQNTLSGSLIGPSQLKDLVNRSYKVGNSWPIINAGAQLPDGRYFFELGKTGSPSYSGDVVIYNSFINRVR